MAQSLRRVSGSAWVTLEGRRILEIRSAAGAQTPELAAVRSSAVLRKLADNPAVAPEQWGDYIERA